MSTTGSRLHWSTGPPKSSHTTRTTCWRPWKPAVIDLLPHHLETVQRILSEHVPGCEVRAFGSRATWEAWEHSDLDLAVSCDGRADRGVIARLKEAFEESDLPIRVDVLDWHDIADGFRQAIESDFEVIQQASQHAGRRTVALGDLVDNFDSRRVPLSRRVRSARPGPYPYYGATGVMDYVDDYLFEGLHLLVAEDGSVETPTGTPFVQLVDGQFWVNNHAHVLQSSSDEETRYLYYALSAVQVRPFISGSVQEKLSQANLNQIPVPYLSRKPDRSAIVRILGVLDEKIRLNRRTGATIEEMARALFRSWFMDFEPVHTKAQGRRSGLPPALDELFPHSFESSALGEIPAGWQVKTLGDVINVNPRRSIRRGDVATHVEMAAMPTSGPQVRSWTDRAFTSGSRFIRGDTLLARITPSLENGKTALVDFLDEGETGWGSTEFIVLRPKPPWPPEIAYVLARQPDFREHAIVNMTGTSGRQRVPAEAVAAYILAVPPSPVAEAFGDLVQPWFERAMCLGRQSRSLATLRDTLLPKLLSAELRVEDARGFLTGVDT